DTIHMARCAVNPVTMQTKKYKIKPAKVTKNVAIVGGGIGGMEVALVSAIRGHSVTIYERSSELGGVFIAASNFSFKEKDKALLAWYRHQINKYKNIKVVFNKEIKDLTEISADEIVVATGATANHLTIPGNANIIEASDYLTNNVEVKDKVLIIGGGLTGCEIAYDLRLKGKHPIIVEMKQDLIAVKGVCLANSSYLRDYFKLHNVPVYLNSKVNEIKDGKAIIADKNGKTVTVDVDNVITSIGYKANPLANKDVNIHIVGDAYHVGNLRTVIWRAWDVAMKL
ncbi:MAG: NAD(P)/FAD-dependent oxidoreductase, partial [Bacilli bacterium]|nr:NAD(P)/FAD-dependent oxidoreductase [Bacilli bacterium]